jgi:NOL1/NOP2/fmu family ribosome biogenesis protein
VLRVKKSGTRLGRLIRGELIPDHELALSDMVSSEFPAIELTREDAIRYLRRDDLKAELVGAGWYLIKFQQVCLGWIKISQGKIKNNYPMSWRILMQP